MKEVVHSRELLTRLEPTEVEAYLRSTGWSVSDAQPGRASFWRRVNERSGEEFEIVCLRNKTFGDYAERTAELLEAVGQIEGRAPDDVYGSITHAAFDTAELQIVRHDAKDGDIPLKAGAAAFQGAMKLYAAAAAAETGERKPYYGALLSAQVNKFLSESVRLGQTRRGSYVITIATRLPHQGSLALNLPSHEPYERRVMLRLVTALQVAREAAIRNTEEDFHKGVEQGVSADLCDAVGKMAEGEEFQGLNLHLRWSWLRPVGATVPRTLSFSPELVRNLREGAAHLRFRKPQTDFMLVGKVIRLERYPEEEAGTVGILGFVGSEPESVSVNLNKADYRQATAAHADSTTVVCVGELKRSGRGYTLLQARNFQVMPAQYDVNRPQADLAADATVPYGKPPPRTRKKTTAKPPRKRK